MSDDMTAGGIVFNNMRINSIGSNSGVFAGLNIQYLWHSDTSFEAGFGTISGNGNFMESPYNIVTDPESSSEMLKYFEELVETRIRKRGI